MQRMKVDKAVKVFNVGDEFLVHVFKAHLAASICTFSAKSVSEAIPHDTSVEWLRSTAEILIRDTLMSEAAPTDQVYAMHRGFLHLAFMYMDLRNAIRFEEGAQIVRHWKLWLPRFIERTMQNKAQN